jgi:hypothetical protein
MTSTVSNSRDPEDRSPRTRRGARFSEGSARAVLVDLVRRSSTHPHEFKVTVTVTARVSAEPSRPSSPSKRPRSDRARPPASSPVRDAAGSNLFSLTHHPVRRASLRSLPLATQLRIGQEPGDSSRTRDGRKRPRHRRGLSSPTPPQTRTGSRGLWRHPPKTTPPAELRPSLPTPQCVPASGCASSNRVRFGPEPTLLAVRA